MYKLSLLAIVIVCEATRCLCEIAIDARCDWKDSRVVINRKLFVTSYTYSQQIHRRLPKVDFRRDVCVEPDYGRLGARVRQSTDGHG